MSMASYMSMPCVLYYNIDLYDIFGIHVSKMYMAYLLFMYVYGK